MDIPTSGSGILKSIGGVQRSGRLTNPWTRAAGAGFSTCLVGGFDLRHRVNSTVMRLLLIRRELFIYLLLVSFLSACSTAVTTRQSPEYATASAEDLKLDIEPKLQSILPKGWSLKRMGNTFELTRSQKLWVYNPMQRPVREKLEDTVRNAGTEVYFTLTLRFEPLLKKEEYETFKRQRAAFEKIVNEGARSIDEWSRGVTEFHKHKLPVYFTDRYSIYADKPDGFPQKVYPEAAAVECNQAIAALDKLFNRYEPVSRKNSDFQLRA